MLKWIKSLFGFRDYQIKRYDLKNLDLVFIIKIYDDSGFSYTDERLVLNRRGNNILLFPCYLLNSLAFAISSI